MDSILRAFILGFLTFATCVILTIGFIFLRNGQDVGANVDNKFQEANLSIIDNEVLSIAKKEKLTGEDVLQYIAKYQSDYNIILKNDRLITICSKDIPFSMNNPNNLDYVDVTKEYKCRIELDENGVPNAIIFWANGTAEVGSKYMSSLNKMFTQDGEMTVPDGCTSVTINACASGKGIYAGEYLLDFTLPVTPGDKLKFQLTYQGSTKIIQTHNGVDTLVKELRAGIVGDPTYGIESTNTSLLGYVTGIDGEAGVSFLDGSVYSNAGTLGDDACLGGLGGYGGAFGFGGGGGAGAYVDTADSVGTTPFSVVTYGYDNDEKTEDDIDDTVIVAAKGGGQDEAKFYDKTSATTIKTITLGKGGNGSLGINRYDTTLGFSIKGGNGKAGTLYYGGSGGILESFNTKELGKQLAFIIGASGGGAAGGYGAGGGQGGYGVKDTSKITDEFGIVADDAICDNGSDGTPTGGMVLISMSITK